MSKLLGRLAMDQVSGRPAFVSQQYAAAGVSGSEVTSGSMLADIRELASAVHADEIAAQGDRNRLMASSYGFDVIDDSKPFVFSNGYALIPIQGFLLNRFSYSWGFATGYNFIRNQVAAAVDDPDVKAIIFDVNSCGGTVAGCQETADVLFAARDKKPLIAVVDHNCHSAAYFLASQCTHMAVTPSGDVANIGVLFMHFDVSEMMSNMGVKITFITAGSHKVDGTPYEPLSDDVKEEFQADINLTYDTFVAAVVRGRGLDEQVVRDTEARCYGAAAALALGLVDAVQNPSDAVEAYFNSCDEDTDDTGEDSPDAGDDETTEDNEETAMTVKPGTTAAKPGATAPGATATEVTSDQAAADARTAERQRISGIQTHAEAVGREELAAHLALNTDMDVDTASGILAASPKKAAPVAPAATPAETTAAAPAKQTDSAFTQAMNNGKHPNVGASEASGQGEGGGDTDDGSMTPAARILTAQRKTGSVATKQQPTRH